MLFPSLRSLKPASLLLAALTAAALPAFAGDTYTSTSSKDKNPVIEKPTEEPRFYMELLGGGEFDTGALSFLSNGDAARPAPALVSGPNIAPVSFTSRPAYFQARDFSEAHDAAVINGRLNLGYQVLPYLSVFVGGTYSHAGGDHRANVGFVTDAAGAIGPAGMNYNLFGGTGQYQAFSGRAGFKLNTPRTILDLLHLPHAIKPYFSLSAGGKYVDDQNIDFYTENHSFYDTGRFRLFEASWVFTTEATLGYSLQLTRNVGITLESGYGYDTAPEKGGLPVGYSGINNAGQRLYSTVSFGAHFSF